MKAIILAAGRGSRMENLTDDRPKCLAMLRGRPLIEWQIDALQKAGIDEVAIVRGYRKEMLEPFAVKFFDNPRWAETNMVASLACAADWLSSTPCIVSYSDIFYDAAAAYALKQSTDDLAITYDPHWLHLWEKRFADPLSDAETFRIAPDGTLLEIGKQPHDIAEVQGQYMGLLRFTPFAWQAVERLRDSLDAGVRDKLDMTSMLQRLIDTRTIRIRAIPYFGEWGEVDNKNDLDLYNR